MNLSMPPMQRRAVAILWGSFLMAIVGEGAFFSFIDPPALSAFGERLAGSPPAVYTCGFFFFWGIGAMAALISSGLISNRA